jgi:hypothetical protein
MGNNEFEKLCKTTVANNFNLHAEKTDDIVMTEDDVYIVWSCKTLQNNKAMVSTKMHDQMYYELTYNGDKKELYFDAYKKWDNQCLSFADNDAAKNGLNPAA